VAGSRRAPVRRGAGFPERRGALGTRFLLALGSYQEPSLQSMSLRWDLIGFPRFIIAYFVICAISASFRDGDFLTAQELRERQRGKRALA